MQILNVAAFAVSGYSSTKSRTCKPFNPLLGETYEADYPDKGLRFISEKVKTEIFKFPDAVSITFFNMRVFGLIVLFNHSNSLWNATNL